MIVDLLEMERREGHEEGESPDEMVRRYLATFTVSDTHGPIEKGSRASEDEEDEEAVGCKVILEDVYLESVSPPAVRHAQTFC